MSSGRTSSPVLGAAVSGVAVTTSDGRGEVCEMGRLERTRVSGERDWDSASGAVADAYFPHQLDPRDVGSSAAGADVAVTAVGALRIARIGWGAEVAVRSDHPGAYGINIPLGGLLETTVGGRTIVSTPGLGTINPPDTPTDIIRWSSSCTIIGVKIDRDLMRREAIRMGGDDGVLEIPGQIDLRATAAASWLRLVRSVASQPTDDPLLAAPLIADRLAASLTDGFLLAVLPERPDDLIALRPRIITRVLDALHADPTRAWTAAEMASVAGVGVRRLQEGFREYVGKTPREYLTDLRLRGVHDDLLAGTATSITDAALAWGFTHSGRFSSAFRKRYGVAPSELLRQN